MSTQETIVLEASVVLKIVKHSSEHYPHSVSGPVFGFDKSAEDITISQSFPFPNNNNNTNDHHHQEGYSFKFKSNLKFQNEVLEQYKEIGLGIKFLGWYLSSNGGKYLTQQVIDSMVQQQILKEQNNDQTNVLLLVHDPSKTKDGYLSLRAFKLNEKLVQVYKNDKKFYTKNLVENDINFKNLLLEVPLTIHNSHLTNLKILSLPKPENNNALKLSNSTSNITTTIENMFDAIDDFNYDQNNFNYYQRSYSRELTKINHWKQKRKLENLNKLKQNPNTPESELLSLDESEWSKQFKLPQEPSRYENLVISGLLNNYCNDLEVDGATELIKSFAVSKGLDI